MTCSTCNGSGVDTRRADGSGEGKLVAIPTITVAYGPGQQPACPDCDGPDLDDEDAVEVLGAFFASFRLNGADEVLDAMHRYGRASWLGVDLSTGPDVIGYWNAAERRPCTAAEIAAIRAADEPANTPPAA